MEKTDLDVMHAWKNMHELEARKVTLKYWKTRDRETGVSPMHSYSGSFSLWDDDFNIESVHDRCEHTLVCLLDIVG